MAEFRDYETATSEADAGRQGSEPIRIPTEYGRTLEFRPKLPARIVLDARKAVKGNMSQDEQIDFFIGFGEKISGPENWEFLTENMDLEELSEFINGELLPRYGFGGEEEEGKAEEGESPSMTSSESGERSILTSSAFGLIPGGLSTPESSPGPASSTG